MTGGPFKARPFCNLYACLGVMGEGIDPLTPSATCTITCKVLLSPTPSNTTVSVTF